MSGNVLLHFKIPIMKTHFSVWGSEGCHLKGTSFKVVSNSVCGIMNVRRKWRHSYGVLQGTKNCISIIIHVAMLSFVCEGSL